MIEYAMIGQFEVAQKLHFCFESMSRDAFNPDGLGKLLLSYCSASAGVIGASFVIAKLFSIPLSLSMCGSGLISFSVSSLVTLGGYCGIIGSCPRDQDKVFLLGIIGTFFSVPVVAIGGLFYLFGL